MIRDAGIDMDKLEPEPMDRPFGTGSGAGVIFGASGGVAEAALRTAHEFLTGKPAQELDVKEARGLKDIKELSLAIGDIKLRVAVCNTP
jgi:iron only hydrogenase large subunit-like protein